MDSSCPLIEDLYNTEHRTDMEVQQLELLNFMDGLTLNSQQQGDHIWHDPFACNIPDVPHVYPNQPVPVEPEMMSQNHAVAPAVQPYSPEFPAIETLEITIQYRSREVLRTTVSSPRVQLHYLTVDPSLHAHPVCFPGTEQLLDHKQIEYTQRILTSIQRGLLLEVRETGVYAVRQDKCHVFASTSSSSEAHHPHPTKLPQKQGVELLSFEKYLNGKGPLVSRFFFFSK